MASTRITIVLDVQHEPEVDLPLRAAEFLERTLGGRRRPPQRRRRPGGDRGRRLDPPRGENGQLGPLFRAFGET